MKYAKNSILIKAKCAGTQGLSCLLKMNLKKSAVEIPNFHFWFSTSNSVQTFVHHGFLSSMRELKSKVIRTCNLKLPSYLFRNTMVCSEGLKLESDMHYLSGPQEHPRVGAVRRSVKRIFRQYCNKYKSPSQIVQMVSLPFLDR